MEIMKMMLFTSPRHLQQSSPNNCGLIYFVSKTKASRNAINFSLIHFILTNRTSVNGCMEYGPNIQILLYSYNDELYLQIIKLLKPQLLIISLTVRIFTCR